jgi:hypothetical protein
MKAEMHMGMQAMFALNSLYEQMSGLAKSPQSTFKQISTKVCRCFPHLVSAVSLICIGVGFNDFPDCRSRQIKQR